MTSKEKQIENFYEWISGIFGQISNGYPFQRSVYIDNFMIVQSEFKSGNKIHMRSECFFLLFRTLLFFHIMDF
jgi:hypothetical protein